VENSGKQSKAIRIKLGWFNQEKTGEFEYNEGCGGCMRDKFAEIDEFAKPYKATVRSFYFSLSGICKGYWCRFL
jgi:hypothetical protein